LRNTEELKKKTRRKKEWRNKERNKGSLRRRNGKIYN
jgi:hypothetical protein